MNERVFVFDAIIQKVLVRPPGTMGDWEMSIPSSAQLAAIFWAFMSSPPRTPPAKCNQVALSSGFSTS